MKWGACKTGIIPFTMKKIYLTYALVVIGFALTANPMWMPISFLNKLSFDKNKNWQINLNLSFDRIDSVAISSSSGKSKCKELTPHPQQGVPFNGLIITTDSLISKVNINPDGDSVSIISFFHNIYLNETNQLTETCIYGNYKNSSLPKPTKDQGIKAFWINGNVPFYHSLCDSLGNMKGTIKGHIYNRDNVLITKGSININPYLAVNGYLTWDAIDIGGDGTYNFKLNSQIYDINKIDIYSYRYQSPYYWIGSSKITPLDFSIYPDSTIDLDIHLLENFTGIQKEVARSNDLFKIFPNPINGGSFHYETGIPVKATRCGLDLIDMTGRKMKSYEIVENSGELQLPSTISNGTYLLQLQMNGRKIFSEQIIVSKK